MSKAGTAHGTAEPNQRRALQPPLLAEHSGVPHTSRI